MMVGPLSAKHQTVCEVDVKKSECSTITRLYNMLAEKKRRFLLVY